MANGWGGRRENQGRPKGSRNKRTKALLERLEAEDADPIKVLVEFIHDEDPELRFRAAKELLPYTYPRLSTVDLGITGTLPDVSIKIVPDDD